MLQKSVILQSVRVEGEKKFEVNIDTRMGLRRVHNLRAEVFGDREHAETYQRCMGSYISAYQELKRKGR